MDKVTVGNTRGQLAGSGVWVQVAEIFRTGQKFKTRMLVDSFEDECGVINRGVYDEADCIVDYP